MEFTKNLQRLEDWDNARWKFYRGGPKNYKPIPNGIACPGCGSELEDSYPGMMLAGHPPRIEARCSLCDWEGSRIA